MLYYVTQVATLRTFDAVLSVAYGLHDYLNNNNTLTSHDYGGKVCEYTDAVPHPDGKLLLEYIKKVIR